MVISDTKIKKLLASKVLTITPLEDEQIQGASVDIRLGNSFSFTEEYEGIITMDKQIQYKTIEAESYLLLPGQFVLATTREFVSLPDNIAAYVEGRSSIGRMGLFIQNAGWIDPGFAGEITLELFNANKNAIELKAGRRVGQLVFHWMDESADNPYNGKYQGQEGATGSMIHKDWEAL